MSKERISEENLCVHYYSLLGFFFLIVYIFSPLFIREKGSEWEHEQGEGQMEREKQIP